MKATFFLLLTAFALVACNDDNPGEKKSHTKKKDRSLKAAGFFPLQSNGSKFAPLSEPWLIPFDVGQKRRTDPYLLQPTQNDIYDFAWESFIALNWQYLTTTDTGQMGLRGRPDTSAPAVPITNNTVPSPVVVWETYMVPDDVFVDPASWSVVWGPPDFLSLTNRLRELRPPDYNGQFAPGINQPYTHANVPTGPAVDQKRNFLRYEVTLNQTYFNYIATFGYYNANTQMKAVENYVNYAWEKMEAPPAGHIDYFQPVPTGIESYVLNQPDYAQQGLIEVKAAWKVLETNGKNPDIPGRYFKRMMMIPQPGANSDGAPKTTYLKKLVGLVGFHIHRVTPHGHLPSTFEHVDNVELFDVPGDPLPLPQTPSLNPGESAGGSKPPYPNGYEVGGLTGQPGLIPLALMANEEPLPPELIPEINISRSTPIPDTVQEVNKRYQSIMANSVWRYYQLIGAQNESGTQDNPFWQAANPGKTENPYLGPGIPNENLGPGIPGPQYSNTTDLVNTTLESYTQPGFSCARCHINAFPQGVMAFPPYEKRFQALHVMSFLLQNALPDDS